MSPRIFAIALSAAVTTIARGQYALDPAWPLPFSFNVSRITAAAVITTSEGVEIHVAQRGLDAPPVLVFDIAGHVTRTWGAHNITSIHGLNAQQGNPDTIWVADAGDFTVKQFDVNGTVLRGVGTPGHGGGGLAPVQFSSPADVSFTSAGSIAISDGDGGSNNRVLVLAGSDLSVEYGIGSNGTGVRRGPLCGDAQALWHPCHTCRLQPGQFESPHSIDVDASAGQFWVANRGDGRLDAFQLSDGLWLGSWGQGACGGGGGDQSAPCLPDALDSPSHLMQSATRGSSPGASASTTRAATCS